MIEGFKDVFRGGQASCPAIASSAFPRGYVLGPELPAPCLLTLREFSVLGITAEPVGGSRAPSRDSPFSIG